MNALKASWFLGSESKRSSHFEKREVSRVWSSDASLSERLAKLGALSRMESNFSVSRAGCCLDAAEPMLSMSRGRSRWRYRQFKENDESLIAGDIYIYIFLEINIHKNYILTSRESTFCSFFLDLQVPGTV